jgi:hypothetical protein
MNFQSCPTLTQSIYLGSPEFLSSQQLQVRQFPTYVLVMLRQIHVHTVFRTTALYSYEYIVTLDQEINHIWTKRWSLSTLIFAVNRYVALILELYPALAQLTGRTVSIKPYSLLYVCQAYLSNYFLEV